MAAVAEFKPTTADAPARPARKLVRARGYYAPDEFEDAVEVPELTSAWEHVGVSFPERELLYLYSMGGSPGGACADIIRSHDLPSGTRIYSQECDYPEPGTFLIASTAAPDDETDARVIEDVLSVHGQRLAMTLLMGTVDEMRTVLPRARLLPFPWKRSTSSSPTRDTRPWTLPRTRPNNSNRANRTGRSG